MGQTLRTTVLSQITVLNICVTNPVLFIFIVHDVPKINSFINKKLSLVQSEEEKVVLHVFVSVYSQEMK